MKPWKFTNKNEFLFEAEYYEAFDVFYVNRVGANSHVKFEYDSEEVEDYLARGIWKRLS